MAVNLHSKALHANRVAGTVSQGAISMPYDIPNWGVDLASGGTLVVTLDVDTGTPGRNYPPHRTIIEAHATGFAGENLSTAKWDASVHRVEYSHDSGDIHAGDWLYGEKLAIKSRRIMHSKRAVHVYREPGRYVHSVFAYDQAGNWGVTSVEIEVIERNHAPDKIVVLAPDGDFSNAPYCLQANRVTTLAAAAARLAIIGTGVQRALYLKRGETYQVTSQVEAENLDVFPWGLGDDPKLMPAIGVGHAFNAWNSYFKAQDMEIVAAYDPVGEKFPTGVFADYLTGYYTGGLVVAIGSDGVDLVVDRCRATGHSSMGVVRAGMTTGTAVMHECRIREFKDYALFGGASEGTIALVGTKIEQHEQAANGGLPRWFFNEENSAEAGWYPSNSHNGFRTANSRNVVVYGNDFFGRHGWTTQQSDVYANNSLIRLNTDGVAGNRSFVSNNWFEGHVTTSSANSALPRVDTMDSIWEFNTFVRDPTNTCCVMVQGMGNTFRNNIMLIPNPVRNTTGTDGPLVALDGAILMGEDPLDGTVSRNEAYSNTIIDLASQAKHSGTFEPVRSYGHPGSLVENNVYYAPNLTVPQVADGPLDLTLLPWTPRYKGHRKSYEYWGSHYTLASAVPVGGSFVMPYRADRNGVMTNAASFAGHFGRHLIQISGLDPAVIGRLSAVQGTITVAFEAGGIRVTNASTVAWPAGGVVSAWLHRGSTAMAMDAGTATPADSLVRGWVTNASGAYEDAASGLVSVFDFTGQPRRGSAHPQAAAGVPSRGAMEVA